jgi:hypothetical protein
MKKIRGLLLIAALALSTVAGLVWTGEIFRANRIAREKFGPSPCWFVQRANGRFPPLMAPGPRGFYLPNPLQQFNRRWLGLFIEDPAVLAPHFAVAARDARGDPALWGWSYRNRDFWSLRKPGGRLGHGGADDFFTDPEQILAACPDLSAPAPDNLTEQQPR